MNQNLSSVLKVAILLLIGAIALTTGLIIKAVPESPTTSEKIEDDTLSPKEEMVLADPSCVTARLNLAMGYIEADRHSDAVDHIETALTLEPDNVKAHYLLGVAYAETDEPEKALEYLEKALRLEGGTVDIYGETYFQIGRVFSLKGEYNKAIDAYHNARAKGPKLHILEELAETYEKIGAIQEASLTYFEMLDRDPTNQKAVDALARMGIDNAIIDEARHIKPNSDQ